MYHGIPVHTARWLQRKKGQHHVSTQPVGWLSATVVSGSIIESVGRVCAATVLSQGTCDSAAGPLKPVQLLYQQSGCDRQSADQRSRALLKYTAKSYGTWGLRKPRESSEMMKFEIDWLICTAALS